MIVQKHFHVCENCFHIWSHSIQEADASDKDPHLCPRCDCGPYRRALTEKYALSLSGALIAIEFKEAIIRLLSND